MSEMLTVSVITVITPCSMVDMTNISKVFTASLMMGADSTSEMSVNVYQTK
jgi:hypothetical protein